jgi:hypothetical protein
MRRDLGDCLEDEMKVPDRYSLGQQNLQDREQPRVGDLRGTEIIDQPPVFRIQPLQQRAHILVGQELGEVCPDDLAQMREQHR